MIKNTRAEREFARDAARAAGRVAQTAFGPDAARRNLATAPIYKPRHLSDCYGFADGWGCEQGCQIGAARDPSYVPTVLPVDLLNEAANRRAE